MTRQPVPLLLEVESAVPYNGWDVKLNGVPVWYKPYDGSVAEEATDEFLTVLAALMRRETGYPLTRPDEADDD